MNDLKFAFRQLLKNPGFTVVAVLMLGLRAAAADSTDASVLLPSPQTIVARHVEAAGGRAALFKHQSYHWTCGVGEKNPARSSPAGRRAGLGSFPAAGEPDSRVEVSFESLDRGVRIEAVAARRVECAVRGVSDHLPGAA